MKRSLSMSPRPHWIMLTRVVSRETIQKRIRDIGKQRAAFTTCMTCATTSDRYQGLPLSSLARETSAIQYVEPYHAPDPQWDRKKRLLGELEAIKALVSAHRDEFDGYLAGLADTVNLADRRRRGASR
jgi:hypothetical protein